MRSRTASCTARRCPGRLLAAPPASACYRAPCLGASPARPARRCRRQGRRSRCARQQSRLVSGERGGVRFSRVLTGDALDGPCRQYGGNCVCEVHLPRPRLGASCAKAICLFYKSLGLVQQPAKQQHHPRNNGVWSIAKPAWPPVLRTLWRMTGVGKRGVGSAKSKKTFKQGLRKTFQTRHIDQVTCVCLQALDSGCAAWQREVTQNATSRRLVPCRQCVTGAIAGRCGTTCTRRATRESCSQRRTARGWGPWAQPTGPPLALRSSSSGLGSSRCCSLTARVEVPPGKRLRQWRLRALAAGPAGTEPARLVGSW